MAASNLIYPFAPEATSDNILSDGEYGVSTDRLSGNVPGIAKQQLVNKAAKQAAAMSYALAEAAAFRTNAEISDDGTGLSTLVAYLKAAFIPAIVSGNAGKYLRINSTYDGVEYVSLPQASTSLFGIIQVATTEEVVTGTDTTKATTCVGVKAAITTAISPLAPKESPTFTGTPQAPTPATSDNSTKLSTTAYVIARIANDRPYATALPIVDGTAAAGASAKVAREDHVHPTDTSRAAVNSPTFTGAPLAPTAPAGTNTTQIATTAFVKTAADAKVSDAIADGVTDKAPSQNAVFDALALKAPKESPAFTGIPTVPTAAEGTNTAQSASTAFVKTAVDSKVSDAIIDGVIDKAPSQNAVFDALSLKADLASPTFTGVPKVPTAANGTDTEQIASTAFVQAAVGGVSGTNIAADTTPELGGDLDLKGFKLLQSEAVPFEFGTNDRGFKLNENGVSQALVINSTAIIDWTKSNKQKKVLTENTGFYFTVPEGAWAGHLILVQDSTTAYTAAFPVDMWASGLVPDLTTLGSHIVVCLVSDGTTIYGSWAVFS